MQLLWAEKEENHENFQRIRYRNRDIKKCWIERLTSQLADVITDAQLQGIIRT